MGVIINIPSWRRDKFCQNHHQVAPLHTFITAHCVHYKRGIFISFPPPLVYFLLQSWFLFLLIPSAVTALTIFIFSSFRLRGRYFFAFFLFSFLVFVIYWTCWWDRKINDLRNYWAENCLIKTNFWGQNPKAILSEYYYCCIFFPFKCPVVGHFRKRAFIFFNATPSWLLYVYFSTGSF